MIDFNGHPLTKKRVGKVTVIVVPVGSVLSFGVYVYLIPVPLVIISA